MQADISFSFGSGQIERHFTLKVLILSKLWEKNEDFIGGQFTHGLQVMDGSDRQ